MGKALSNFFVEAEQYGGLQGKLMLAGITNMTTGQAASVTDTPELVKTFEDAMVTLKRSLKPAMALSSEISTRLQPRATADGLRKHTAAFLDLMSQRSLILGDVVETCRRIDEVATETLNIARVSVWLLADDKSKISCIDLFERKEAKHSAGVELFAKDFAPYFNALATERTIAAHDAQTDPRTSCFTQVYLKPLGITSMLDVPVWVGRKMVGVVCHEHLGPARTWDADEERFAYLMANFVSLAMERKR